MAAHHGVDQGLKTVLQLAQSSVEREDWRAVVFFVHTCEFVSGGVRVSMRVDMSVDSTQALPGD